MWNREIISIPPSDLLFNLHRPSVARSSLVRPCTPIKWILILFSLLLDPTFAIYCLFTVPAWQGRPWWARALPSSGCPRSVSSWTASRTCGKTGACAASCARQTGKEGDRWFYWPGWCIWPITIITDLILFCKGLIATLFCAFVVRAVLPRQVPPDHDQKWLIKAS